MVATLAVVLAFTFALGRDSAASSTRTDRQLTTMHTSCNDWSRSDGGGAHADDRWCAEMVAWMRSADGDAMMMRSQMWDRPDHLRASCRAWADHSDPAPTDRSAARCDDMVDWMQDHSRGDRNGHMMGGR